ncbi:MAG TPA: hydroxymethylbilane synthase [Melioribacteraceae bacterium]|nr:hydroxymethylbilane synthase [Melioribacteraceae bacterium]
MKENLKLVIGTRGSKLAMWQAEFIKSELLKYHPDLIIEIKLIKTKGDKILDVALSKIGDKGLFTKELEEQLLNNEIDLAVHSLKDLQTTLFPGLIIAAITKRHPVEDVFIGKSYCKTIFDIKEGGTVATGALRRRSQLKHLRPDINIVELRGNVTGRIQKFLDSDWDGIILARAGVERLGLNNYISSIIGLDYLLTAPGQGALGIEIRENDEKVIKLVSVLNDKDTEICVRAERQFLKTLEGGCQAPIAAYANILSNGLILDGFVGSLDGSVTFRKRLRGKIKYPEQLGEKLAKEIMEVGAKEILDAIFKDARR